MLLYYIQQIVQVWNCFTEFFYVHVFNVDRFFDKNVPSYFALRRYILKRTELILSAASNNQCLTIYTYIAVTFSLIYS